MCGKSNKISERELIGVDFFSGVGGLTKGFQNSGINVIAGFDNDASVGYAYEKNNFPSKFYNLDINDIKAYLDILEPSLFEYQNNPKIFSACAPCQPFSKQNKKYSKDERKSLMLSFIELVENLSLVNRPDFIFAENVGAMQNRGKEILNDIISRLSLLDYSILPPKVHNSAYYGVPQKRNRLIFLAMRNKYKNKEIFSWDYFENKYATKDNLVPVYKAFEKYEKKFGKKLHKIKAGERCSDDPLHFSRKLSEDNLRKIKKITITGGGREMWDKDDILDCHTKYKGHSDVYGRMSFFEPAPTLTTKCVSLSNGRYGHPDPTQHRAISLREAAILQTMDDFNFGENFSIDKVARMIGNAVPPKLAEKFGMYLYELL